MFNKNISILEVKCTRCASSPIIPYNQWLKWDLAGGGTLKLSVDATGKNDSPWDNIE